MGDFFMGNTTEGLTSTTSTASVAQTEENTTAPYEALPIQPSAPLGEVMVGLLPEPTTIPVRPPRHRMTPEERAAKIAAGINLPGPRPKSEQPIVPTVLTPSTDDYRKLAAKLAALENQINSAPADVVSQNPEPIVSADADALLEALVTKLVALENNDQYRSVWLHFFTHGGVFIGPNYTEELKAACNYLNSQVTDG